MPPIWFIIWMLLSFTWLGYESRWLTVNIVLGKPKRYYSHSEIVELCYRLNWVSKPRAIAGPREWIEPLTGWSWVFEHEHDLDDYQPRVEMAIGGVRYNMTIKQPSIIKDIMRVNKLTKKQKLAYA